MQINDIMKDVESVCKSLAPMARDVFKGLRSDSVTQKSIKFYRTFDEMYEKSHTVISCKAGCNYCCHYHVVVSATEVFAMAEAIAKMSDNQRNNVKNRIKRKAEEASALSADQYIHTNIECAMLIDGECSVYSVRPIACRGHHSADVKVCKETFDDVYSTALAPKDIIREVVFRAFDNLQLMVNHQNGVDTTKYELHAALNEALFNPASFKRWKSGKTAFPSVRDKVTLDEMLSSHG